MAAMNSQKIRDILEEDEEFLSDTSGVSSDFMEDETCFLRKFSSCWEDSDMLKDLCILSSTHNLTQLPFDDQTNGSFQAYI